MKAFGMELLRKRDNPEYKVGIFLNHPMNKPHYFLFAKIFI
jgi:hypothetical protein